MWTLPRILLEIIKINEVLKVLNNIRTLSIYTKRFSLDTLEEMLEKLKSVVNERSNKNNQIQANIKERTSKLQ